VRTGGGEGSTYYESLINSTPNPTAIPFEGGRMPPRAENLTGDMLANIRGRQGIDEDGITDYDVKKLTESRWQYGMPAPGGFHYDEHGLLKKNSDHWATAGKVAAVALPVAATIATGGAASPWLYASIGGVTGAGLAAGQGGSWKDILLGAGVGAGTGYAGAKIGGSGLNAGQQIAAQGALGAGTGALQGGGKGALIGGITGAGGAAAGQIGQQQAAAGASRTQQIMTQAGIQSALGGMTGGAQGALLGAGQGAVNNALYQQRYKQYQQQQRSK
jgi:hypothetical protein